MREQCSTHLAPLSPPGPTQKEQMPLAQVLGAFQQERPKGTAITSHKCKVMILPGCSI